MFQRSYPDSQPRPQFAIHFEKHIAKISSPQVILTESVGTLIAVLVFTPHSFWRR
ncbi:MAG: hypothetical protein ACJAWK_000613 [Candidatus Azotimanducaceae bacterium]|jgi:hypothetical protein